MAAPTLVQQAQQAIKTGRSAEARTLLHQAIQQTPDDYKPWLLLASLASTPEAASSYVYRAETIAPTNPTVLKARAWANQQLGKQPPVPPPPPPAKTRTWPWIVALLLLLLPGAFWAGWQLWTATPLPTAIAALPSSTIPPENQDVPAHSQMGSATLPAPTATLIPATPTSPLAAATAFPTPTNAPGDTLATVLAATYTPIPTQTAAPTPTIAELPPTAEPAAPPTTQPLTGVSAERWIDVNLSTQTLTAYEGDSAVMSSLISSGTSNFPTVVGQFNTWLKRESQDMNGYLLGYDYYLEDVPDIMYFYQDYAIHGAYWHNNFGVPMSHGCVNVNLTDADWLFNWAPLGTLVNVHY